MSINKPDKELKAVDFFCGAGGMTYGLRLAGINVIAGIDIDSTCKETYTTNNPGSVFINVDIRELTEKHLSNNLRIKKRDPALILICCSPCQYWTKINTPKRKSRQSKDLLREFQRFAQYYLPGYIVVENVPGLLRKKEDSGLLEFLAFLKENGYSYDFDILNAYEHGVPQTRQRFLLIASKKTKDIKLPEKESNPDLTVRNFIGDKSIFPRIPDGYKDETSFLHTTMKLSENNIARIIITPKNGGDRYSWKDNDALQIKTYKNRDDLFRDVYGRMFWDRPAPTITTRFPSLSNGRFGHPEEDRAISLREGATLQTFPHNYEFKGLSIVSIARQIGNAVPPELSRRIGQTIKRSWSNANLQN